MRIPKLFILLLGAGLLFTACGNSESKQPDPVEVAKTKADPSDAKELKERLNGRWRAVDDEKSIILFAGSKMTEIYNGQMMSEHSIELFPSCPDACSTGRDLSGTPCFSARGQFNVACYAIVKLEENQLEYSMIGGSGKTLAFTRIVE